MLVRWKSTVRTFPGLLAAVLLIALCVAPPLSTEVLAQSPTDEPSGDIWLLSIDGVIGPATSDYLSRGIEEAADRGASSVILQMDTPGGLDQSMRAIVKAILASPVPVVSFVTPSGARAASAGTYILYASHVAAMAPATNLGAATPVQIGAPGMPQGDDSEPQEDGQSENESGADDERPVPQSAMERKVVNDAVAYIQGLAELRGRNREWATRAVTEGVSLSASEAMENNVIEVIAGNLDDLLEQLDGRSVEIKGETVTLKTANAAVNRVEPGWRSKLLAVITNPNVAYILMLIGIYGLIFEFSNPGMGGPGIVGVISLLLALYAFQALPVSYLGVGLIILGVGLMVAEAFAPSFGVLGVGGAISFVIGSIVLMDTDLPAFQIALPIILALAVASAGLLVFVLGMVVRARKQRVVSGTQGMMGEPAVVEQISRGRPLVRFQGELWYVDSAAPLEVGDKVVVRDIHGLVLVVEKTTEG